MMTQRRKYGRNSNAVARREPTTLANLLKTKDLDVAERVGFEPTCRLPDKTLSRRPRYDHFGTSPYLKTGRSKDLRYGDARRQV